jgi:8-amino-7-oxononanoate synthase
VSSLDEVLERRLTELERAGLLRDRDGGAQRRRVEAAAARLGRPLIDLSSNDYLGFAARTANIDMAAGGAGASRLIHGTRTPHERLERALAEWLGTEDALLFSSGYAANVGVVSALARPEDVIISDALNHASIIDGCRLSRSEVRVVPHRDLDGMRDLLESTRDKTVWVITESYFSMDGTSWDLAALSELTRRYPNAHLVVDEAHALGVFGPSGRGLCAEVGCRPDVVVGTFGKAFGLHGAFVAGSLRTCAWLWNRARSFVYSTATSPALAAAVAERLEWVSAADAERRHLSALSERFHAELGSRFPGCRPRDAWGPIAPLILGSEAAALSATNALGECGILAQAIRPPTVPPNTARLRMTLGTQLSSSDLDYVLETLSHSAPSCSPAVASSTPAART